MKMAKSLLLGTAAGFLAVAGAQAADMPVKAKAVEYVKVCSIYGAGFYYIPGTDTCLKIGGYVRVQSEYNVGGSGIAIGTGGTEINQGLFTRQNTNDVNYTVRGVVTFDARTQTEYGTLRSYIRAGWENRTPQVSGGGTNPCNNGAANSCGNYWDRAFIQFAGFTVGRAQSFFDMYTFGGAYTYLNTRTSGDTGAGGENLWAYTVQFGNGVSYTLSLEDPNGHNKAGTCDGSATCSGDQRRLTADNGLATQSGNNNGFRVPDVVTNLRVDQAWGYLGVSTAIHDASGGYYTTPGSVNNGHPPDTYGWAASISGQLNLPGGDVAGINFVWTKGASGYAVSAGANAMQLYNNSQSVGVGWLQDGIFDSGRVDGQVDQGSPGYWSHQRRLPAHLGPGGDLGRQVAEHAVRRLCQVLSYNDTAKQIINSHLPARPVTAPSRRCACGERGVAAAQHRGRQRQQLQPGLELLPGGYARTQFNPHPLMDIGLDVFYTRLNTAYKGSSVGIFPANGARPAVSTLEDDQGVLSAIVRWQRNFYP